MNNSPCEANWGRRELAVRGIGSSLSRSLLGEMAACLGQTWRIPCQGALIMLAPGVMRTALPGPSLFTDG